MRAFVAAATEGGVTRAAARLYLTPSALSMLIRDLEAELAVRLFDRGGRRFEPSAAGRELLPLLVRALADLDAAFERARAHADHGSDRLTVATSPLLAAELLPGLIATFQAEYPGLRVTINDMGVDAIAQAVRRAQADLGICTAEADMPGFEVRTLHQDRMMLACHPAHPLAAWRAVRWREIVAEPLILMRAGTGLRSLVDRTADELGEKLAPAHEVAHVATAIGLIEAGLGIAVLPAHALANASNHADRAPRIAAVPLTEPVVLRDIVAVTAAGRKLTAAGEAFLAHFQRAMTAPAAKVERAPTRRRQASE